MYPSTSLFIAVGQFAIAILVMFSYPLQVHPCRNCLDKVFHFGAVPVEVKRVGDDEEPYEDEDEHGAGDMTPLKHTVLTAAIIASGFTIAYFVDDLQMGKWTLVLLGQGVEALTFRSSIFCGSYWVYNNLVHLARAILLEGMRDHAVGRHHAYCGFTDDSR